MYNEVYTSLIVDDNTLDKVAKLLVSKDLQGKIIKNEIPWRIMENANFLTDMESLENKSICSIDAWQWTFLKTYVESAPLLGDIAGKKCISKDLYRIVKRRYKCFQDNNLLRSIIAYINEEIDVLIESLHSKVIVGKLLYNISLKMGVNYSFPAKIQGFV